VRAVGCGGAKILQHALQYAVRMAPRLPDDPDASTPARPADRAALAAVTCPAGAATEVHEKLAALARDVVYTTAAMFPTQATQLGIPGHDGELETPSERNRSAYIDKLRRWQQQLGEIAPAGREDLGLVDRNDARLLGAQLAGSLNGLLVRRTDRKDYAAGANNIIGTIFYQLQFLPVAGRDGKTMADVDRAWTDLANRLAKAPQYISPMDAPRCRLWGPELLADLDKPAAAVRAAANY
jgi:hypothetical protein